MTTNTSWIESIYHFSVFGETGAGKTVLANQVHGSPHNDRISFFFNVQEKGYVRGKTIEPDTAQDLLESVRQGIEQGHDKFNIIPASDTGHDELAVLVPLQFRMAKDGVKLQNLVDEAHEIAPSGTKGTPLHKLHKKGRDPGEGPGGIKTGSLTQSPSSLDNDILRQSKFHVWVGEPNTAENDYLRTFNFPTDDVRERNTVEQCMYTESGGEEISHCYSVVKNGKVVDGPVLADPAFADAP